MLIASTCTQEAEYFLGGIPASIFHADRTHRDAALEQLNGLIQDEQWRDMYIRSRLIDGSDYECEEIKQLVLYEREINRVARELK